MNLTTRYLGLELKNPFIVGASPLCDNLDTARSLQDAGVAALVMRSLFEEQIAGAHSPLASPSTFVDERGNEFAEFARYQYSPDDYLRQIERLKGTVTIPIIASLNGHNAGSWIDFASRLEGAG